MSEGDSKEPAKGRTGKQVQPETEKSSGRVAFDARGNPTWQWKTDSGAFDTNISTQRLKKLSADISLEKTDKLKQLTAKDMAIQAAKDAAAKGGGFNPYNSFGRIDDKPVVKHPATAHKQTDHPTKPRQSLATKYANQNLKQQGKAEPRGFWARLKASLRGR